MELKSLPVGVSTFKSIRTSDALYVDKTEYLYKLIAHDNGRYFISRPRRFGKSLTCSTLATIFEGDKKHFKGLWLETSKYNWKKAPVLHLDFNQIPHSTPEELNKSLSETLDFEIQRNGLVSKSEILGLKLKYLIMDLSAKYGPVAVIIDEYDKPLLRQIDKLETAEKMRDVLHELYGAFKGHDLDAHLRFLFVTGVSKFSKVSLFSDVNNLDDITLDEKYAALVGYTDGEVEANFHDHIQALADRRKENYTATFDELKHWYNGFRFSPATTISVYNPVSLHLCLNKQAFDNYWFTTGTPNFLMKIMKHEPVVVKEFIGEPKHEIASSEQDAFEPSIYYKKIKILLLQTGYLTIKDVHAGGQKLELDYPNYEIRSSMTNQIFEFVAQIAPVKFIDYVERFRDALLNDDMEDYCAGTRDMFKLIPYNLLMESENYFQSLFAIMAKMIGAKVQTELASNIGRADVVIQVPESGIALNLKDRVYIFELKFNKTLEKALTQIQRKKYYETFKIEGKKKITLVGINFKYKVKKSGKTKKVDFDVEWKIQKMK